MRVWVSSAIWLRSHLAHLIHWTGWLRGPGERLRPAAAAAPGAHGRVVAPLLGPSRGGRRRRRRGPPALRGHVRRALAGAPVLGPGAVVAPGVALVAAGRAGRREQLVEGGSGGGLGGAPAGRARAAAAGVVGVVLVVGEAVVVRVLRGPRVGLQAAASAGRPALLLPPGVLRPSDSTPLDSAHPAPPRPGPDSSPSTAARAGLAGLPRSLSLARSPALRLRSPPPRRSGSGSGLAAAEEAAARRLPALQARAPALPAHSPQALAWE